MLWADMSRIAASPPRRGGHTSSRQYPLDCAARYRIEALVISAHNMCNAFLRLIASRVISTKLRNTVGPYRTATKALTPGNGPLEISHQFYMDEPKVCISRWDNISEAKQAIEEVAGELGLQTNPSNGGTEVKYAFSCIISGSGKFCTVRKRTRAFDESIRKVLAETKMRYGHSCVERLNVNEKDGEFVLKTPKEELEHTVVYNWCYVALRPKLQIPYQLCGRNSNKRSFASDFYSVLPENMLENETLAHERWARTRLHEWKQREVASRVIANKEIGNIERLAQGFILVATDSVKLLQGTAKCRGRTRRLATNERECVRPSSWPHSNQQCRLHCTAKETAEHIVSACSYWRTHGQVA
ncbi:hypothetical protein OSTOST_01877 [Ostertagia ostertagi]